MDAESAAARICRLSARGERGSPLEHWSLEAAHERHRSRLRRALGAHPLERPRAAQRDVARDVAKLPEICAAIEAERDALVVIVEGEGGHFCAGADISEFVEVYRDAATTHEYVEAIQRGLAALAALDRPTIAAISASRSAAASALALCCDLRFCADDAFLAITPAKLGLLYGHVETRRLVELVGPSRAKDLLFSGRRVLPRRRWRSASSTTSRPPTSCTGMSNPTPLSLPG